MGKEKAAGARGEMMLETSVGRLVIEHLRSFSFLSSVIPGFCLNSFHDLKPYVSMS